MACEVKVLRVGYARWVGPKRLQADCTMTLVRGEKNTLVDTGLPQSREVLLQALESEGLGPEDITCVVSTHGHSDHVGNLGLFPGALHLLSNEVFQGDEYFLEHDFTGGRTYQVEEGVEVVSTPGHSSHDVSVLVQTSQGVVAVVGDLFESAADQEEETLWLQFSESPEVQRASRQQILQRADWIVPGHGDIFPVAEKS